MYICICKKINEKRIEDEFLSGNTSRNGIAEKTGAGNQCGKCNEAITKKVKELTNRGH